MSKYELVGLWRQMFHTHPPGGFTKGLIARYLAYHIQEKAFGSLGRESKNFLDALARGREPNAPPPRRLKPGTVISRVFQGERHEVTVAADSFIWREKTYPSLSHDRARDHRHLLEWTTVFRGANGPGQRAKNRARPERHVSSQFESQSATEPPRPPLPDSPGGARRQACVPGKPSLRDLHPRID